MSRFSEAYNYRPAGFDLCRRKTCGPYSGSYGLRGSCGACGLNPCGCYGQYDPHGLCGSCGLNPCGCERMYRYIKTPICSRSLCLDDYDHSHDHHAPTPTPTPTPAAAPVASSGTPATPALVPAPTHHRGCKCEQCTHGDHGCGHGDHGCGHGHGCMCGHGYGCRCGMYGCGYVKRVLNNELWSSTGTYSTCRFPYSICRHDSGCACDNCS